MLSARGDTGIRKIGSDMSCMRILAYERRAALVTEGEGLFSRIDRSGRERSKARGCFDGAKPPDPSQIVHLRASKFVAFGIVRLSLPVAEQPKSPTASASLRR